MHSILYVSMMWCRCYGKVIVVRGCGKDTGESAMTARTQQGARVYAMDGSHHNPGRVVARAIIIRQGT
jgi:hypothetical protein